ncbi:putative oxidoreductase [Chryseobacterium defluvii]|uniref:Putative oxidoreductase n=1 Tax=Chryseobacterium defluvii TaxID=160396 RepID=A0A840KFD6_9FLAO|nr:DoxX family protein [Chryseobacterium defluvii]MBB4807906.1 putative oxidoreductase [Chryseobacterium defluvii]
MKNTVLLRYSLALILIMHSVPPIITGSVNSFGKDYLDSMGFAPVGIYLAWAVKLTHLISVVFLVMNRYLKPLAFANIVIFITGIIMIHGAEGWYVVGGGKNGVEFNFLLIACFLSLAFPDGLFRKKENIS